MEQNTLKIASATRPSSNQPIPINAKRVFKGEIFEVYQWPQEMYDGSFATFEKLKRPDTVIVIPVTADGQIVMTKQEQPNKKPFLGVAGGRVDDGEDEVTAAHRELMEETGYKAKQLDLWFAYQPLSKIDWAIFVYIAKGCTKVAEITPDNGEKIEPFLVQFDGFIDIALKEKFADQEITFKILEAKLDSQKWTELTQLIMSPTE